MKITKNMQEACRLVNARLKRYAGEVYFAYDAHGDMLVENLQAFEDALEAYKGTHTNYAEARRVLRG